MALILDMCIRAPLNWATANHLNQRKKDICLVVLSLSPTPLPSQPPTSISMSPSAHASTHTQKIRGKKILDFNWVGYWYDAKQKRSALEIRKSFPIAVWKKTEKRRKRETETGAGCLSVKLNTLLALNLQDFQWKKKKEKFLSENSTFQNWDDNLLNFMTYHCDAFHDPQFYLDSLNACENHTKL